MAQEHSISLGELTSAVNKSVERAVAAQKGQLKVEKDFIMGRILDAALGHAQAEKLAENIVSGLPPAMKGQFTPKTLTAGPGHIIVGFVLPPSVLHE